MDNNLIIRSIIKVKISTASLFKINLPLRFPFITSAGRLTTKDFILIVLTDDDGYSGYGECSAFSIPFYTEEFRDSAFLLLKTQLLPTLIGQNITTPEQLQDIFLHIKGNNMAKAAIDSAVWDLFAKKNHQSLAKVIGGNKKQVLSGVSIGIQDSPEQLVSKVRNYIQTGYQRIKVKIKPGTDYQYLKAVRDSFPNIMLMADANSAYTLADIDKLQRLDELNLLMIEQPLESDDLLHHAVLQRELATPICLDESINSLADAKAMVQLGSGRIINIKVSKVGGLTIAKQIQAFATKNNVACWCGGCLVQELPGLQISQLPHFLVIPSQMISQPLPVIFFTTSLSLRSYLITEKLMSLQLLELVLTLIGT